MYKNIEINEEGINENIEESKIVRRVFRNRKNENKNLSLRVTELKISTNHYEEDIFVLKDGIIEFKGLKKNLLLKIKRIHYNIRITNYIRVRCDICKIDIDRAPYCRHLKNKKHLKILSQKETIVLRKNPIKTVVKEDK